MLFFNDGDSTGLTCFLLVFEKGINIESCSSMTSNGFVTVFLNFNFVMSYITSKHKGFCFNSLAAICLPDDIRFERKMKKQDLVIIFILK